MTQQKLWENEISSRTIDCGVVENSVEGKEGIRIKIEENAALFEAQYDPFYKAKLGLK